ncbi:MAG: restriction endonuclease subunit S [Acinetobacter sp.]
MTAPKLRFKEFDGDWSPYVLKDFVSFRKGKGISKADISEDGINECIRYGELYTTYGQVITKVQSKTHVSKSECVLSQGGDVLIPASGETQIDIATASCILKEDVILSGDLNVLSHKENGEWLAYYLSSAKKLDIAQLAQGNSVVHLYSSQLKDLKINKPSKAEQTKIASFLSSVDEKISQLTQKHELLSQYKQGMMQKLFSQQIRFKADDGSEFGEWEEKTLGSLGVFKSGQGFPEKYQGGKTGVPFFKVSDMNTYGNEKRMVVANNYVDADSILEMKVKVILDESIIFAKVGAAVFLERKRLATNFLIDNNMMAFTPDPKLNINFIKQFLDTIKFSNFVQVGALPSYNAGDLAIIPIHIPCVVEQTKIANFLSAIDQKIDVVAQQIEQTKQWKKGLLQQMFV